MLAARAIQSSIVIAGPTAIGKTLLALTLIALRPDVFEIVSADSIQVYRRFDVGSAKPSDSERASVPFHLIDVADPGDDFTLVDYQSLALDAVSDIAGRGRIPLIVGGTGLYIRSITEGLGVPLAGPDEALRAEFADFARLEGNKALHDRLAAVDPESALRIHENDLKRTIRALEVHVLSGRPLSAWHRDDAAREKLKPSRYIVLDRDRSDLYRLIEERTESMFRDGILEETAKLRAEGYGASLKPMTSLGYLQANQVIDGTLTVAEAVEQAKAATRQYARRQLIWFRGEPFSDWIDVGGKVVDDIADELIASIRL